VKNLVRVVLLLSIPFLFTGCVTYTLKDAGHHKFGTMNIELESSWNEAPITIGNKTKVWTKEGLFLDRLILINGVKHESAIFHNTNNDTPMPKFNKASLPHELADLIKTSLTLLNGGEQAVEITQMKPVRLDQHLGVNIFFSYYNADDLEMKGRCIVAVVDENLYGLLFNAAAIEYFDRNHSEIDKLFQGIRFES